MATEVFAAVYNRTRGAAARVLRMADVSPAEQEELLQDVFAVVACKLPTRDRSVPVASWVRGVARYVALNYRALRYVQNERPAADPDGLAKYAAAGASPEVQVAARERLRLYLAGLREGDRAAVELAALGYTAREIAAELGIPAGTVRTRLRRARSRRSDT